MTSAFQGFYLPPYRDLAESFPTPSAGSPVPHAFLAQLAANLHGMFYPLSIVNARNDNAFDALEVYSPTLTGLTVGTFYKGTGTNGLQYNAAFSRVGQICTLFLSVDITAMESDIAISLPVPAARTNVPQVVGSGTIRTGGGSLYSFTGMLDDQQVKFYQPDNASNDGKVGDTTPVDPSGGGVILTFQGRYRCIEPPDGYLSDETRYRKSG